MLTLTVENKYILTYIL